MDFTSHTSILEWQNLCYSVPLESKGFFNIRNSRERKELMVLKNVSGSVTSGNFVAILGPSGSGKTTLLAAVSRRLRGELQGEIHLNGVYVDRSGMTRLTSYLPQTDISRDNLTASEHLFFMCHFKMTKHAKRVAKIHLVNKLLTKVGLRRESSTLLSKLSGGERRRLGVAEELIRNPVFLFCDEPTTGLDSFNAFSVIKTLHDLTVHKANNEQPESYGNAIEMQATPVENLQPNEISHFQEHYQKGVICSIHQPSSEVFQLFTHVILMNGGRVIYQGSSENACIFFSKMGIYCPRNCNPADFYIKFLSEQSNLLDFCRISEKNSGVSNKERKTWENCKMNLNSFTRPFNQISWMKQVFYLLYRSTKNLKSAFYEDFYKTIFLMITAVTMGTIYANTKGYEQSSIQNIQGLMFMLSVEVIFTSVYVVVHEFPSSLPLIRREVGENTYSLSAYYMAQFLRRVPQAILSSFIFLAVTLAIMNIVSGFFVYLSMGITLTIVSLTATSYGLFLSSTFESDRMGSEIAAPFDLLFLVCGGFYINLNSIPVLKYISLFFYCYEALSFDYWSGVESIDCPENYGEKCFQNGKEVLQEFALSSWPGTIMVDYLGLLIISVVMNFMAFFFISKYVRKVGYY